MYMNCESKMKKKKTCKSLTLEKIVGGALEGGKRRKP